MKKALFILFAAVSTVANAQNTVAKTATDIAPLLIGEKIHLQQQFLRVKPFEKPKIVRSGQLNPVRCARE